MARTRQYLPLLLLVVSLKCFSGELPPDPSAPCLESLAAKPELQILKGKVDMSSTNSPTLDMLANSKKPNQAEKTAISNLVTEAEECWRLGEEWRGTSLPASVNSLLDQYLVFSKSLFADLYGGKITYGDFAKTRAAAAAKFKTDVSDITQKLTAERNAQQEKQAQAELQQRQEVESKNQAIEQQNDLIRAQNEQAKRAAMLQLLSQQRQQQQMLYQQQMNAIQQNMPRQPIRTNCYTLGNGTNCTSQ